MPETSITGTDVDDEPLEVSLSTTAAPEELWARWLYLREVAEKVGARMTEAGQRWKETTDPAVKDGMWAEYEAQTREFRVVTSWKDLFYVAYIFATDGADCAALDDNPLLG